MHSILPLFFFFSSRRRHTRYWRDWSSERVLFRSARAVIAVDPVEFKLETAKQLGATHTATTMAEATELARSMTNGQGADAAVVAVGVTTGEHIARAPVSIREAGTLVLTRTGGMRSSGSPMSPTQFTGFPKRNQGAALRGCTP